MLLTVKGAFKKGKVELAEDAPEIEEAEVMITFLVPAAGSLLARGAATPGETAEKTVESGASRPAESKVDPSKFEVTSEVPRQKLVGLMGMFGRGVLTDGRRTENLLRNLCGEKSPELPMLLGALQNGAVARLAALRPGEPVEPRLEEVVQIMVSQEGWPEIAARWSVESWSLALGLIAPEQCTIRGREPEKPAARKASAEDPSRPTLYVGSGKNAYPTIAAALLAAQGNHRIVVAPGRYHESLIIDKPVEIVGDGEPDEIMIISQGQPCLQMQSPAAAVRGISFRAREAYAIDIFTGQLLMEDCDITSLWPASVAVHGSTANPLLRRCRIHDSQQYGVVFTDNCAGILEDCEIYNNIQPDVLIEDGANPVLRGCQIHSGKSNGVRVIGGGKGQFEGCDIYTHMGSEVEVGQDGNPIFKNCKIREGNNRGVSVAQKGQGTFQDCDIYGNAWAGIAIEDEGNPRLFRCQIRNGAAYGASIHNRGEGLFEDCDIFLNAMEGAIAAQESTPTFRRCKIHDCTQIAVRVTENAKAVLEECEIFRNGVAGVQIDRGGDPVLRNCSIHESGDVGIIVRDHGIGTIENCTIVNHPRGSLQLEPNAATIITGGQITQAEAA